LAPPFETLCVAGQEGLLDWRQSISWLQMPRLGLATEEGGKELPATGRAARSELSMGTSNVPLSAYRDEHGHDLVGRTANKSECTPMQHRGSDEPPIRRVKINVKVDWQYWSWIPTLATPAGG
jgi:hypothetical protein